MDFKQELFSDYVFEDHENDSSKAKSQFDFIFLDDFISDESMLEDTISRCIDISPADLSESSFPADKTGCLDTLQRCPDGLINRLPLGETPFLASFSKAQKPDISAGLGRRAAQIERRKICEYLLKQYRFKVHKETLFVFDGLCWRKLNGNDANVFVDSQLKKQDLSYCLGTADIQEIVKQLLLASEIQHPKEFQSPENCINFTDGTLNLETGQFYVHDPADEFTFFINCTYEEVCDCQQSGEVFERFADCVSGGDPFVRQQLLELTAIVLSGVRLKYFYVMLGPSHTGKSQFGRFLEELIGRENVESVRDIKDFSSRFTTGEIAGKRLVTCLDLPNTPIPPLALGKIKELVGDDSIKGEVKYQRGFTYTQKPLLLFAGNYPIRLPSTENDIAFLNRMVTIPFYNPCEEENMVHHLYRELLSESPYIIREAITAFRELAMRNYRVTRADVPSEYQVKARYDYIRDICEFILTNCRAEAHSEVETKALWEAYVRFVDGKAGEITSYINFSRSLEGAFFNAQIHATQVKRVYGTGDRGYKGVCLLE